MSTSDYDGVYLNKSTLIDSEAYPLICYGYIELDRFVQVWLMSLSNIRGQDSD